MPILFAMMKNDPEADTLVQECADVLMESYDAVFANNEGFCVEMLSRDTNVLMFFNDREDTYNILAQVPGTVMIAVAGAKV